MGLKKISSPPTPCLAQGHEPPNAYAYTPGEYEWTCDACGNKITFTVVGGGTL